jgi:hypothetical protein
MRFSTNRRIVLLLAVSILPAFLVFFTLAACGVPLSGPSPEPSPFVSPKESVNKPAPRCTLNEFPVTTSGTNAPFASSATASPPAEPDPAENSLVSGETLYSATLKRDLLVMLLAYPDDVTGAEVKTDQLFLVMKSGNRLLYDDQRAKNEADLFSGADIQDTLAIKYPLQETSGLMAAGIDPGRMRSYPLLDELYGSKKAEVAGFLTRISFGSRHVLFNRNAGAAAALEKAAGEAGRLASLMPVAAGYLYPDSGTFNYRLIAGTKRLSPHAYGIAIDLNSSRGGYWRWTDKQSGARQIKAYPKEIVRIFEANGFIWGGKWAHFDLFHFEYRPELILKARYFSKPPDIRARWYLGADLSDPVVLLKIQYINSLLG